MGVKRFQICWVYGDSGLVKARRFNDLKQWVRTANESEEDFATRVDAEAADDKGSQNCEPDTTGPDTAA
jgi:hypothetical protein